MEVQQTSSSPDKGVNPVNGNLLFTDTIEVDESPTDADRRLTGNNLPV
jgi:hypothetical protein